MGCQESKTIKIISEPQKKIKEINIDLKEDDNQWNIEPKKEEMIRRPPQARVSQDWIITPNHNNHTRS
jgi:hypothetical protein